MLNLLAPTGQMTARGRILWSFLHCLGPAQQTQYPRIWEGSITIAHMQAPCIGLPADRVDFGLSTFNEAATSGETRTWSPEGKIVQVNPMTMRCLVKKKIFAMQFHKASIHIIGMHEARAKADSIDTILAPDGKPLYVAAFWSLQTRWFRRVCCLGLPSTSVR